MNKHHPLAVIAAKSILLGTLASAAAPAFAQRPLPLPPPQSIEGKRPAPWNTTQSPSRMVFLNGVNIGNVRDQELQNVTVRIDDAGNVNIVAPQYDVSRESSYHPLLPAELPRFPKSQAQHPGIPEGRYSKFPNPTAASEPMQAMQPRLNSPEAQPSQTNQPITAHAGQAQEPQMQNRAELKTSSDNELGMPTVPPATPVTSSSGIDSRIPPISSPNSLGNAPENQM